MKSTSQKKKESRERRHARVRAKVIGSAKRPRLAVFRSAKHVYAQLIDDAAGKTLAAVDEREMKLKKGAPAEGGSASGGKVAAAYAAGQALAEKAKKAGIASVVFDRGGYAYHGRIKALAEGARAGGLEF